MKNSKIFVKNLKLGIYRKPAPNIKERFGWIENYTLIKERSELNSYIHFINSRRFDELQNVKVKTYKGDNV